MTAPVNAVAVGQAAELADRAVEERPHGRARYVMDGCRCDRCKEANARYELHRTRMLAYGRWEPFVDAAPVREHIDMLRAAGVGKRQIARAAGMSIDRLLYGGRSGRPVARVRQSTADRILAVRPGLDILADKTLVDATGTSRRLRALVTLGWPQLWLFDRLGLVRSTASTIVLGRQARCTALVARTVRDHYDAMQWELPPTGTPAQATAVARARAFAAARSWWPPLAWEDDTIDDPLARPTRGTKLPADRLADDAVVADLVAGRRPSSRPRSVDRAAATARLEAAGLTAAEIARRVGSSQRNVVRVRATTRRAS